MDKTSLLSAMLERRKPLDLLFPLKGGASNEVGVRKESMTAAQRLRAAVNLTADAVKAVSLTAMEALREGAAFIGIVGEQDELIDPFQHLDAPALNLFGGSIIGSKERTKVPQCIPITFLLFRFLAISKENQKQI